MVCGLTILFFILIELFFKVGYIDLVTPSHSDLYRYLLVSESKWLPANFLTPRPLSLAYVKIAGLTHQPWLFFYLLALPALCFVALLAYSVAGWGVSRQGILPLAALFFVCFGSPFFYPLFQYDFGGMLGGMFAVLAISTGLKSIKENGDGSKLWWFAPIALTLLSVESKPTYSILILAIAFISAIFFKSNRSRLLFAAVFMVLTYVYLKDKLLGSAFLAQSDTASPYAVVLDPIKNAQTLMFYIQNTFTAALVWTTVLASTTLLIYRKWKLLSLLAVLAVSASIPMAFLVNRTWDIYAWYSTVIIGLIIMLAVSHLVISINEGQNVKNRALAFVAIVSIIVGLIIHALSQHTALEWTVSNQQYNRNILTALETINGTNERRILLAGIQGPYHPLRNTAFVERSFAKIGKFDVLLKNNERAWNGMSSAQSNGIYTEKIDWTKYSLIYVFNEKGGIATKRTNKEVISMTPYNRDLLFYCGISDINKNSAPLAVTKAIVCLNNNEEYAHSIALSGVIGIEKIPQPWYYYHLAKAYEAVGNNKMASDLLSNAIKFEPDNPLFLATLTEVQSKMELTL